MCITTFGQAKNVVGFEGEPAARYVSRCIELIVRVINRGVEMFILKSICAVEYGSEKYRVFLLLLLLLLPSRKFHQPIETSEMRKLRPPLQNAKSNVPI